VRGPIVRERRNWKAGKEIIYCNIAIRSRLGKALTWLRQLLPSASIPALMDILSPSFPPMPSKPLGHPRGKPARNGCLQRERRPALHPRGGGRIYPRRDGIGADPEAIFLTDGASKGVQTILKLLLASPTDGIMIPSPSTAL